MTSACTRVENQDCKSVFPAIAAAWGVITAISGEFMEHNTWLTVPAGRPERLATYARFPQGVPLSMSGKAYMFPAPRSSR